MKTNIDEPCAGNLQARFFRGSCSNKTQTRGVKLQLLPNSKKGKEESLLENSFKNIYARDENGRTALHYAVDAKTVKLLVEKGANVNAADARGYTALHLAVTEKRLETVRELIKSGGNVNAEEYGNKCIPLHLACMVGEKEIVEELVKAGGEIEHEDECGMTAMDYAKNSKEITEILKKETERIEKLFEQQSGKPSMRG